MFDADPTPPSGDRATTRPDVEAERAAVGSHIVTELDALAEFLPEDPDHPPLVTEVPAPLAVSAVPATVSGSNRWSDRASERPSAPELRAVVCEKRIMLERTGERKEDAQSRRGQVQLAATLERQSQAIEHAVVGAGRMTELLTTLETRISGLANVAQTVADLEQRAVDASTGLEQRVGEFESQRHRIEQALSEATRLSDALVSLEQRLSRLSDRQTLEGRQASSSQPRDLHDIRTTMSAAKTALTTSAWVRARRGAVGVGVGVMAVLIAVALTLTHHVPRPRGATVQAATDSIDSAGSAAPLVRDQGADAPPTTAREPSREQEAEKADAPARPFTGDLTIESEPRDATVFIDQRRIGETPVHLKAFRAGSHAIRIDREGYERWTAGVLVAAGRQTRVSAQLERNRDR